MNPYNLKLVKNTTRLLHISNCLANRSLSKYRFFNLNFQWPIASCGCPWTPDVRLLTSSTQSNQENLNPKKILRKGLVSVNLCLHRVIVVQSIQISHFEQEFYELSCNFKLTKFYVVQCVVHVVNLHIVDFFHNN